MHLQKVFAWAAVLVTLLAVTGTTRAGPITLTAAGIAEGFTLSTFADRFPNNGAVGPVGITNLSTGGIMVSSYATGVNVVFATDVDGQHFSGGAVSATNYGGNNPAGLATTGNGVFEALQQTGSVIRVNNNGDLLGTVVTGTPAATGMAVNPNNGHLSCPRSAITPFGTSIQLRVPRPHF
jgi:hypothetical protein